MNFLRIYIYIYISSFLPFGNNLNIYAQIIPKCSNRRNERPSENGDKWTMGGQSGRLLRILYAAQGKGARWTNTLEKYFHFCFSKLPNVNSSMWTLEGVKAADHWEFSKKEFTENPRSSQRITFGGFQTTYHRLSEIYVNGAALKIRSFMFQRQDSVNMKRSWGPHLMGRFEHMDINGWVNPDKFVAQILEKAWMGGSRTTDARKIPEITNAGF